MSSDLVTKESLIDDIVTTVRLYNALNLAHLHTVADVVQYSESDIGKLKNLGKDSIRELKDMLACYGFALADESKGKIAVIAVYAASVSSASAI